MPPKKAKGSGVSTSTFFDLQAEIAKHEEEFAKNRAAGKGKVIIGGIKRPDKVRPLTSLSFVFFLFPSLDLFVYMYRNQQYGLAPIKALPTAQLEISNSKLLANQRWNRRGRYWKRRQKFMRS